jgi:aryl sulfotransferase
LSGGRFGWLASWPRSGNTWLRLLLESLIQGGKQVDITAVKLKVNVTSRAEFDDHFGVESTSLTWAEINAMRPALHRAIAKDFHGPLILRKVHDRCWRTVDDEPVFPPELSRGVVYIARDPRDVAVSYADFYGITLDQAIERMNDTRTTLAYSQHGSGVQLPQPMGTWSQHVASWLDESAMPVHLVRYEDLAADTPGKLTHVAEFLGLATADAPQAALAVSFRSLQEQEREKGFRERSPECSRFFGHGRAGRWYSVLTSTQAARLEQDHGAVMERLGYLY